MAAIGLDEEINLQSFMDLDFLQPGTGQHKAIIH
jgi:hypothetical protein